jgi:hypothetical protein
MIIRGWQDAPEDLRKAISEYLGEREEALFG